MQVHVVLIVILYSYLELSVKLFAQLRNMEILLLRTLYVKTVHQNAPPAIHLLFANRVIADIFCKIKNALLPVLAPHTKILAL
jgi:hypothetical protein